MSYMGLGEFPESVRQLLQKLSWLDRNRLLYPPGDVTMARRFQESIIQEMEASIKDGENEEIMLARLRKHANTDRS